MLTRLIIDFPQAQPTVHEDGRIHFGLHAPSAGKVLLTGLGDRAPIPGDPVFDNYAPENLWAMEAEMRQEIIPYVE